MFVFFIDLEILEPFQVMQMKGLRKDMAGLGEVCWSCGI